MNFSRLQHVLRLSELEEGHFVDDVRGGIQDSA